MMSDVRYGDLTYQEIKNRVAQGCLAILPTGCTEQQGPHLPVDIDTWVAETLSIAATAKTKEQYGVDALVLPALPFGPTPEHRNFGSGYIHLPQEVHEATVHAILISLVEQGFRRMIVWRGCGGHRLERAVERFNASYLGHAKAFQPELPHHRIWCTVGDPAIPGGHADSYATSLALYLRPDDVRRDKIVNSKSQEVAWDDPQLDFSRYSATGVIGDPTHASASLGEQLWRELVEDVAITLRTLAFEPI